MTRTLTRTLTRIGFGRGALRDGALGILGPPRCAGCGLRDGPLCSRCRRLLQPPAYREPPERLDRLLMGWDYSGPARALVLALKLRAERVCAGPLAEALGTRVRRDGLRPEVLTWVPGRKRDVARRGFDHAAEIAHRLAQTLGLPAADLLDRAQDRPDQTQLSGEERRSNLLGTFTGRRCPARVALVDDLVTTGATASACAQALREAGAETIELLVATSKAGRRSDP